MTGLAVGLSFGLGVLLVLAACSSPKSSAPRFFWFRQRWERLAHDLRLAGLPDVGPGALIAASALCAFVMGTAAFAWSQVGAIAGCFAVMAGLAPGFIVRGRARRRRTVVREVWPDAIDHVASAIRAGLALPEALSQLGARGPEALRSSFTAFAEDYRTSGKFIPALDRLKDQLADPVADRVLEALRLAREVGGTDLGRILTTLTAFLRQDLHTRAELHTRQGWTIAGARLAAAAPWLVIAVLATRPESVTAYRSVTGAVVLFGGGMLTVVAYTAMLRIARLPEEDRVLR
ncbi:MAG: type II secretion system F family protein [Actinomycetota bacterium]